MAIDLKKKYKINLRKRPKPKPLIKEYKQEQEVIPPCEKKSLLRAAMIVAAYHFFLVNK